ncbi:MAG: VOC family protein [Deltaproteobacteria bacterium]
MNHSVQHPDAVAAATTSSKIRDAGVLKPMSKSVAEILGLPPVDQVAWLVHDIDKALLSFEPIFGAFTRMESEIQGSIFRGKKTDMKLDIAFGKSGELEIELIAVLKGDGPHREFLDSRGEGVHHIRFRVEDIAEPRRKLEDLGFKAIWEHGMPEMNIHWAYFEAPQDQGGAVVELLQMPG